MEFFTAGDVLSNTSSADPADPVTVSVEDTIQDALSLMLEHDFDQLPVLAGGQVEGIVTYKTTAKYVKSMDEPLIDETSVKFALEQNPEFVQSDHDLFELFETLAKDDHVLIGDTDNLEGILTRYDVFYFLEEQVEPFLKIGDIEQSLRRLFQNSCENLDECIEEAFADRAEHDDKFEVPERLEDFSFDDYRLFMMRNLDQFPDEVSEQREVVESLLDATREIRNGLLHFRVNVDEVDRDLLDIAHSYFTALADAS